MPTCRLLSYAVADGPHNMAADEVLLESAAAGTASLRLYGWSEATLSLGYFQPERLRHTDARLAELPFVRRPSGGDALVHHHELTYALALPAGAPWHGKEPWARRMHLIIAEALAELGVPARLHLPSPQSPRFSGLLCFHHWTAGDLIVGVGKVVGSAQRRRSGALMQHGAILLAGSPYTPSLPGIRELTGRTLTVEETEAAVLRQFARETGWDLVASNWGPDEQRRIEELAVGKYGQDAWNRKR
ncbi:MAG TPA: biotin/lipoate A/B protein ligase family protein [Gemmataceae bacterium]|nr:biotin/lipoate A/B protein ligase family protein [Gemmataceae bacterium]